MFKVFNKDENNHLAGDLNINSNEFPTEVTKFGNENTELTNEVNKLSLCDLRLAINHYQSVDLGAAKKRNLLQGEFDERLNKLFKEIE